MSVVRDIRTATGPDRGPAGQLVDDKAWQHLGITGQEFRRNWYAGAYTNDPRPEVQALDRLMRTGQWINVETTSPAAQR